LQHSPRPSSWNKGDLLLREADVGTVRGERGWEKRRMEEKGGKRTHLFTF